MTAPQRHLKKVSDDISKRSRKMTTSDFGWPSVRQCYNETGRI